MVSTKTQIAGFEFDNCLMNAAGVACMTTEELEGSEELSCGDVCDQDSDLRIPCWQSRATLPRCAAWFDQFDGAT